MKMISAPTAILLGSVLISLAILISGGTIKLEGLKDIKSTSATVASNTSNKEAVQPTPDATQVKIKPLSSDDHFRGKTSARIILFEYSDLECPFCKGFQTTAQQAVESYNGQLAWVFRQFPITQLHPKAKKEAEATECAGELGGNEAFWKMVDKIYEVTPSNNGLDLATLPDLAAQVGLDRDKFKSCLDSGKYAQRVEADHQSGIEAEVEGTPGNILLDTKTGKTSVLPGAVPLSDVKTAVDGLLKP